MQSAANFIFLTILINFLKRKATIIITVCHDSIAGVLDGTLIKIAQPLERIAAYKCRKKFCALILQATCTKNLKFTSVSTVWPGSMHVVGQERIKDVEH